MMRGAIFDMDGLLLDTEKFWQRGWYELAGERGITLPEDFTAQISGTGGSQMEAVIRRNFFVDDPKPLIAECRVRVYRIEETEVPVKPGAEELLSGLRGLGLRLAVGSSSPLEMIRKNLRIAGLDGFFDVLASGREAAHPKPAPDVFLLAAQKLGIPPEECYVFEDSPSGVKAGFGAGCVTVMVPDLVEPAEEIRGCCAGVFSDLSAVWRAIEEKRL